MSNKLVKLGSLVGPKGDPGFTIVGEISAPHDLDNLIGNTSTYQPKINDAWIIKNNSDDSKITDISYKNGAVWVYRGEEYEYPEGSISYAPFEYVTNLRGPKGEVSQNIHFASTYNDFVTAKYYNETMKVGDAVIDNGEADFSRKGNMYKITNISEYVEDENSELYGKWVEATDINQIKSNSQVLIVSESLSGEKFNPGYYCMQKTGDETYDDYKNFVFLNPGVWNTDGAWFAVYFFDANNNFVWRVMQKYDNYNIYLAEKEPGYNNCIFVRLNPSYSEPEWNACWNQTEDLTVPGSSVTQNMCSITGWGSNKSTSEWKTFTYSSTFKRKILAPSITINKDARNKLYINDEDISPLSIFYLRYLDTNPRCFSFYDTEYNNNASIYCNDTDANLYIGSGDENNEFIFDSNGYFKNSDTNKWIGVYGTKNNNPTDWRGYTTSVTSNNIKSQTFKIFIYLTKDLLEPSNPKVTIDTNIIIELDPNKPHVYNAGTNISINDLTINATGYKYDSTTRSFAAGENINTATGNWSFAEGNGTIASGDYSHAGGNQTISSGENSHSEGYKTTASGKSSHTEGYGVEAVGEASHAEGWHNLVSSNSPIYTVYQDETDNTKYRIISDFQGTDGGGDGIFYLMYGMTFLYNNKYYYVTEVFYEDDSKTKPVAFRLNNSINKSNTNIDIKLLLGKSIGQGAHTEGCNTVAYGHYAHAEGNTTRAAGANSHSEGSETSAVGANSHSEGHACKAVGNYSHAEGGYTTATGNCSHAEGSGSIGIGDYSHAEGFSSRAEGFASHAEGHESLSIGSNSHTEGYNTIATNYTEHAEGRSNKSNKGSSLKDKTLSSIGIGESETDRKNAFEVMQNGDIYVYGLGDYDGTNAVETNTEGKKGQSLQECIPYTWDGSTSTMALTGKIEASDGFYETSDARKKDIQGELSLDKAYDFIRNCEPILYNLKGCDKTQIGLIAQEVRELFPEIVNEDSEGYLSLDYAKLTVIILRVLKDLIDKK